MSTTIRPIRGEEKPDPDEEPERSSPEKRAQEVCSEYVPWAFGYHPRPGMESLVGLSPSKMDLTYVNRRRRLR